MNAASNPLTHRISAWLGRPLIAGLALLATTAPVFANTTGGCVDSPENATLVLALLGGSVAAVGWWRRHRNAEHRNP